MRVPPSGRGSALIDPSWCSTTLRAIARPMPVPGNVSRVCRRWNIPKIRSAYCGSMPIPLSSTAKRQTAPSRSALTRTCGTVPGATNLIALVIRFWSSCASWPGSPVTVGRSSHSIAGGGSPVTRVGDRRDERAHVDRLRRALGARRCASRRAGPRSAPACGRRRRSRARRTRRPPRSGSSPWRRRRSSRNEAIVRSGSERSCDATYANSASSAFERSSSRARSSRLRWASRSAVTSRATANAPTTPSSPVSGITRIS